MRDKSRGAALIEFAIVLPFILLMTAGMINVGSALWQFQQFTDAARYAARTTSHRSGHGITDCNLLIVRAEISAQQYVNNANINRFNWWALPVATIIVGDYDTFSIQFIDVQFDTQGDSNCIFCFQGFLKYIDLQVRGTFPLEKPCA
jgi:hypothetical protein